MKQPAILELRPTQFVLGMKELEFKIPKIASMGARELSEYCDDHKIPVVIGPLNELYVIDHHHFARACWELDIRAYSIKIVKDLSQKKETEFWNTMVERGWVYLYDQFGMGPHLPSALPCDIRCLADDPYRSLAWALVNAGHIRKNNLPFFEFQWAAFFRRNLEIRLHSKSSFQGAIFEASKIAHSPAARGLPGFLKKKLVAAS